MNVLDLLEEAHQHRLTLFVDEAQKLKVNAPSGVNPPPEFIQKVKSHRDELIKFLVENNPSGQHEQQAQIPKIDRKKHDRIPLTYAQKAIWFLDELEGSTAYHIPMSLTLTDTIIPDQLRAAYVQVIRNNESLRTVINAASGVPYQKIQEQEEWPFSSMVFDTSSTAYEEFVQDQLGKPFDLKTGPLIRAFHVRYEDCQKLLVIVHHIVFDGWSGALFLKELNDQYQQKSAGLNKGKSIDYFDYAVWENGRQDASENQSGLDFWQDSLDGFQSTELATDLQRPGTPSKAGRTISITLKTDLSRSLHHFAIEEKTSLYVLMASAFNLLLYNYTGESDLTVGTPVANRQHRELESVIGFFTNTVLIRTEVKPEMTFRSWLLECSDKMMQFQQHGNVPLVKVAESMKEERNETGGLFNIMFAIANYPEAEMLQLGAEDKLDFLPTSQFDLTAEVEEKKGAIRVRMNYCTDLFHQDSVERFARHYETLLQAIMTKPDESLESYSLISKDEHLKIEQFTNPAVVRSDNKTTVVDLFENAAKTYPEHTALVSGLASITYQELCEKSNQWSHLLQEKGVVPGGKVAVSLDRSIDMVVILFGILKAGAAYVPIDPVLPLSRKMYILEHTEANIAIIDHEAPVSDSTVKFIDKEAAEASLSQYNAKRCGCKPEGSDLAYVIYTSGSTGAPKGVMVNHKALAVMSQNMQKLYPVTRNGRHLFKTNFMFDVSCAELFTWFHAGGSLAVLPKGQESDAQAITEIISDQQVSHINFVPSMLEVFLQEASQSDLTSLEYVFSAGEALPRTLIDSFDQSGIKAALINLYGPTEATVYATGFETKEFKLGKVVPIGKPLPHVKAYILDKKLEMAPIGVEGELYLGGNALAIGYFNNQNQTRERFIDHPFVPGEQLYRTGDAVKWAPDGNILFLGRLDDQVKFRGYRIELGEISYHLNQRPEIDAAIVLIKSIDEAQFLVAYYLGSVEDSTQLKMYLETHLPSYMIPTYFVHLEDFPRLPSGKINKKLLPLPVKIQHKDFVAPADEVEHKLVQIWSELLQIPEQKISTTMNFFRNGGHSLMATRMISLIQEELVVNFPVRTIFQYPTIGDLAKYIRVVTKPVEATEDFETIEL